MLRNITKKLFLLDFRTTERNKSTNGADKFFTLDKEGSREISNFSKVCVISQDLNINISLQLVIWLKKEKNSPLKKGENAIQKIT